MKKFLSSFLLFALVTLSVLSGGCGETQKETQEDRNAKEVNALRKGAVNGSSIAQMSLAQLYTAGNKGVDIDPSASLFWLRKVAAKGNPDVQYIVGISFYVGEGVSKNQEEGLYWINKAAQQGNREAMEFLNKTPHGIISDTPSNPIIWGYVFSGAVFYDIFGAYGWVATVAVLIAIAAAPIGIPAILLFLWYFIA